ncbi:MAG: hypothetical protein MJA83_04640 [Gammaproteobacteria bacterium]|nr:hypothetical protein [Gammaproteobacteria bacterium]
MITKKLIFMGILVFGLTACATQPSQPINTAGAEKAQAAGSEEGSKETQTVAARSEQRSKINSDGMICRLEKRTGSHRSVKVCRSAADVEEGERRNQDALDKRRRRGLSGLGGN